jgi:hypothetical protein
VSSLPMCSSFSKSCCCRTCMENDSQQFIFLPLLHVFHNYTVCSGFPCLCLLLRMCNAYAEIGLFVLIRLASHISIDLSVYIIHKYDNVCLSLNLQNMSAQQAV